MRLAVLQADQQHEAQMNMLREEFKTKNAVMQSQLNEAVEEMEADMGRCAEIMAERVCFVFFCFMRVRNK